MVLERLLILIAALVVCGAALGVGRFLLRQRTRKLAKLAVPEALTKLAPPGPALLYFTTKQCAQCRLQQAPILTQLATATDVSILTVDAVEQEALASFYGIMTVPTTVWLDRMHRPAAINHGLTGLAQLRQQAQEICAQ